MAKSRLKNPLMKSLPISAQELCESVRESLPFDPSRLNRVLRVDTSRGVAEVQAHTSWRTLAAHLRPGDAATHEIRNLRASVSESIAWNAAGPDGRPTVSHVESFTMVTPDGMLRRVDRISNPGLFALVLGGQGLFGVLYSVTLRLESLARALSEAQPAEDVVGRADARGPRRLRLLIPPDQVHALLAETRERCAHWRIAIEGIRMRRIRAEEETFLRWARRDYVEIRLAMGRASNLGMQVRTTQLRRELIDVAISRGGSFPIACTPEATRLQTERCYPQLAEFLVEQRRIDPHARWTNAWLRHHRSLLGREACEVRWQRHVEP
jgi:hypothetical protein